MNLFPIRSEEDHARAVSLIEDLWGRELDASAEHFRDQLCALVDAWESAFVPLGGRDPLAAIDSRRRALGWSQRELARRLGWSSSGRMSEILSGRRPLTLGMIRDISSVLAIPLNVLVRDGDDERERDRGEWVWLPAEVASEVNQAAICRGQTASEFTCSALMSAADAAWNSGRPHASACSADGPRPFTVSRSSAAGDRQGGKLEDAAKLATVHTIGEKRSPGSGLDCMTEEAA